MKFLIGYPIWCKVDMMEWLMEGIRDNIDHQRADVLFLFDACDDGSESEFYSKAPDILSKFNYATLNTAIDKSETDLHNVIMKYFMNAGSWDMLIVPQDDNKINGKTLLDDIEGLSLKYGDKLGLIGGRDGFRQCYSNMASSPFSVSLTERFLAIGEFAERPLLNTGPLVYPRKLIADIGYHDTDYYYAMYTEVDYAARSHKEGFINGVLGMNIIHQKFGRIKATKMDGNIAAPDIERFRNRWQGWL